SGIEFSGEVAELLPTLQNGGSELLFKYYLKTPEGKNYALDHVLFFNRRPPLVLAENKFYLLRNAPPPELIEHWRSQPAIPVRKLSHRVLMHLRKTQGENAEGWDQLCVVHGAWPEFVFELLDDTVRLRLLAKSDKDQSAWVWNGHDWQLKEPRKRPAEKPEILDDPRLEPATQWLRNLDWFTSEPG